ncbi:MAG: prepilin-type N-terminal cleavage/methylation domain-containing protein [Solirubrobacterales bacterium]
MSHGQSGFTIVEVVVATLILMLGAMATFGLLGSATKNTQRAKATQVALDRAQQEMEELRGMTNEELALTATPPHSENPLNPNYRVNAANATFALTREPPGDYEKLVVNGGSLYGGGFVEGGAVDPGPASFVSGDVSGKVHRYVVWRNDESCSEEDCPGEQDFKQVVVAVKLDTPGNLAAERGYVEVQSDFVDPTDSEANDPAPGPGGEVVTAQQFFLADTPCADSGSTARQEITEDHLLHNTLGTCADGPQTGSTAGAPDALLLGTPPDPAPEDPGDPPLYDYSDDSYLEPNPDTDKGVQILRDDTSGCHYDPEGTTNPEAQVHRWVSDPLESEFTMEGDVTIEFYTRSLNDSLHTGTLCIYLFERHEEGEPLAATDTLLTNAAGGAPYWTYTPEDNEYWWRNAWTKVRLTMAFEEAPHTIPAGDRIGVALSVERSNTSADAIPVMYDHPDNPTRIEVDTSTPIDGG